MMTPGTLYVCAVPIGNLADATPRLRHVLESVSIVACEDTRVTRRLVDLLELDVDARFIAHHDHNQVPSARGIVQLLREGADVALVSDAGTPAVSDPGAALVDAAHEAQIPVAVVPGPSAVVAALSVAGFLTTIWRFCGFLPRKAVDLERLVTTYAREVLVAFESPHRIVESLERIARAQPERDVVVCRELTKRHEEIMRGRAAEVAASLTADEATVRGEIVVVLDAIATATEVAPSEALALAGALVDEGVRVKRACAIAADVHGGSPRALFGALVAAREP